MNNSLEKCVHKYDIINQKKGSGFMFGAKTIAYFIVNYLYKSDSPTTNLKLQKIMYYLQAHFLVHNNKALFSDEIVAWKYGPVVESVYSEFRKCGSFSIEKEYPIAEEIGGKVETEITDLLDRSIEYSAMDLVRMTHNDLPWTETKQSEVISKESIQKFYNENPNRLI